MADVHIYAPEATSKAIRWIACYGCKDTGRVEQRSPVLVSFFKWHDPNATCLRCGERLGCDRPFSPGWRAQSMRDAHRRAAEAGLRVPKSVMTIDRPSRRPRRSCPR